MTSDSFQRLVPDRTLIQRVSDFAIDAWGIADWAVNTAVSTATSLVVRVIRR